MENTEKKIKVLIKPQCDAEIRNRFITKFGEKCEFVFEENEIRDSITTAEVVIGEPEESELRKLDAGSISVLSKKYHSTNVNKLAAWLRRIQK